MTLYAEILSSRFNAKRKAKENTVQLDNDTLVYIFQ